MRVLSFAFLILFGLCGNASAWGDIGHKIVCEIAMKAALPATRAEIRRLIQLDEKFDNFSDSCTGPDHPHVRGPEHFVNLPRNQAKCALTAIAREMERLSQPTDDEDKLKALKYLGHWVGDLHQPLHISFADDKGGNGIGVSGECTGRLHSTWDTCLVVAAVGSNVKTAAKKLFDATSAADREDWIASEPIDWANESLKFTRAPATKYCKLQGASCAAGEDPVDIDTGYVTMSTPIISGRLVKAGVRLAHLLNKALAESE
jgi:hypothetical protein